uniref:Uncharacterized protein n=1 Tax=Astyanax mexicanus TaxID=7994 RepID=A0A8B9KQJ4_ASTMX
NNNNNNNNNNDTFLFYLQKSVYFYSFFYSYFQDAEIRYEAQICKLVLEKQELEWQKESLQRQVDRMTNEHSESLATVKKQGKHQLSAELKDKEITSLKEELKLLQVNPPCGVSVSCFYVLSLLNSSSYIFHYMVNIRQQWEKTFHG